MWGTFGCDRCERPFRTQRALDQHKANSPRHHICCGSDFSSQFELREHWEQSTEHSYCSRPGCGKLFDDNKELEDHREKAHHWCRSCRRFFRSAADLIEHYEQSPLHHYCSACKQHFMSESNLQSHLNSSKHRALDVTCCGRECTAGFVSRSAMILHLEAGTCVSGLNRRAVDDNARRLDRRNVITHSADDIVRRYAADGSFNADTLRCNLCRESFGTRRALEQHLASPRHRDKMYFCPYNSCQVHFSTLSALCQHIESKRCGVRRLTSVKKILKRIIVQMGRQTSTDDESN